MNKTAIKNFAIWARVNLIESAKQRAFEYQIEEGGELDSTLEAIGDRLLTQTEKNQRRQLIDQINAKGYEQVMEEIAYTWFNRFIALRYMEVNGFLPSKVRVFTDEEGNFKPQILKEAMSVEIEGLDKNLVMDLLHKQDNEELYKTLIIAQCNELSKGLPGMFEKIQNYTELLFPKNLLKSDSVLDRMVNDIPEEDWTDQVEIIGWMYQYYISEKHEEVVGILKGNIKKEDIPAATQLFTPEWIAEYIVDNSLGRYWIERNPMSKLVDKLQFFVTPKDGKITYIDEAVKPEELTVFDPCMGSGNIILHAFEVLMEIYRECGYSDRDAAVSIVENNIYGLDIDGRAGQLAYFSVMMKARQYNRRAFNLGLKPNVLCIEESNGIGQFYCSGVTNDEIQNIVGEYLISAFKDAKEIGTIKVVDEHNFKLFDEYLESIKTNSDQMGFESSEWFDKTLPMMEHLSHQAQIMTRKYVAVCTNPPYMNKLSGNLKDFVNKEYKDYSGDLFSAFIYRNFGFCKKGGYSGLMTPNVWMFIKTYEKLRSYIFNNKSIATLVQMAKGAFFQEATVDICVFVLSNIYSNNKGLYFRLEDFKGGMDVQKQKVLEAIENKECGYFYEATESTFSQIPGTPIAYWVSSKIIGYFEELNKLSDWGDIRSGMQTGNNNLFLRMWYEVVFNNIKFDTDENENLDFIEEKWFPQPKGGAFRKWYGNLEYVVDFYKKGKALSEYDGTSIIKNPQYYFKKGISWSHTTSKSFSGRFMPKGMIFNVEAPTLYLNDSESIEYVLGFMNTKVFDKLFLVINQTMHYVTGDVAKIPLIDISNKVLADNIESKTRNNLYLSKVDWDSFETSWEFKKHPLI